MKDNEYTIQETIVTVEHLLRLGNFYDKFTDDYTRSSDRSISIDQAFVNCFKLEALFELEIVDFSFNNSSDWIIYGHDMDDVANIILKRFKKEYRDWYVMESL